MQNVEIWNLWYLHILCLGFIIHSNIKSEFCICFECVRNIRATDMCQSCRPSHNHYRSREHTHQAATSGLHSEAETNIQPSLTCHQISILQHQLYTYNHRTICNKPTRSPEISRQQVQKLTPQFCLHPPPPQIFSLKMLEMRNEMRIVFLKKIKFGIKNKNKGMEDIDFHCPYLLSGETTSHLTSKWSATFQYFQKTHFFLKMLEIA